MRRFAQSAAGEEVIQYIRYMGWSPVLMVQRAGTMRRFARLAAGEVIQYIRYMGWSLALMIQRAGTMRSFAPLAAGEEVHTVHQIHGLVTGAHGPEGWNNEKICAVGGR
jgi:hypothetical protein